MVCVVWWVGVLFEVVCDVFMDYEGFSVYLFFFRKVQIVEEVNLQDLVELVEFDSLGWSFKVCQDLDFFFCFGIVFMCLM